MSAVAWRLTRRPAVWSLAPGVRRQSTAPPGQWRVVYEGGLARAARVMKLASVASLVGASAAVPFFFAGDSDVPQAARTVLAATTLGMTGSSTALAAWALGPYVTALSVRDSSAEIGPRTPLLVDTMTVLARRRTRLVFPAMFGPATQPLASWAVLPPDAELDQLARDVLAQINPGRPAPVALARPGDAFYAHLQGELSPEMKRIIAASPCSGAE
ncbi:hypothetical protein H4R18_000707 [Coemansia javaensis]|uniref:Uncharacterized protein n=1 Tax=Coemansia javaensis TaxID=2761396 RepID=A0A9W8HLU7_9FUNG|nr:hypothetical protein H4R18_000707 [Coemansia javaensis]